MTLLELSQVYLDSARKLDERIAELNAQLGETTEPSKLLNLNTRLRLLREMRLDVRSTGIRLKNYYKTEGASYAKTNDPL